MSNYKILLISLLLFTCHILKAQEENITINEQNVTTQTDTAMSSSAVEDSSISKAAKALQEAANDSKTKSKIILAQFYYQKSYNAFKDNNLKRTKKNFNLFLDTLKSIDIDPALYSVIFDNLNEILKQLNSIYSSTATIITSIAKDHSIAMSSKDNSLVEKYIAIYSSKPLQKKGYSLL
jgi:signal recognition particle GTPase